MQFRCDNCGRLTKGPDINAAPRKRYYCPECEKKIATTLVKQEAAFRREITKIWDDLADATGRRIRIGMCVPAKQVLVYTGMVELAQLLGEDLIVTEETIDGGLEWSFMTWHDGVQYVYFTHGDLPEDAKVIRKWREEHETF